VKNLSGEEGGGRRGGLSQRERERRGETAEMNEKKERGKKKETNRDGRCQNDGTPSQYLRRPVVNATACHCQKLDVCLMLHQANGLPSYRRCPAVAAAQKSNLALFFSNTSSLFFSIAKKGVQGAPREGALLRS